MRCVKVVPGGGNRLPGFGAVRIVETRVRNRAAQSDNPTLGDASGGGCASVAQTRDIRPGLKAARLLGLIELLQVVQLWKKAMPNSMVNAGTPTRYH